ncbi:hypothetical protein ACPPVW_18320 [Leifsonia sp. McL0607]|uniref:hypothetical protein n=1 Tax=Leifsonia sp. McL0607 TaxID=3415672 RepID=UPI003CE678B2
MRIRGVIQSTKVTELTASADDVQTAREAIEAQVPDGVRPAPGAQHDGARRYRRRHRPRSSIGDTGA